MTVTDLDAGVAAEVEVELGRVRDAYVYGRPRWNVPTFPDLKTTPTS